MAYQIQYGQTIVKYEIREKCKTKHHINLARWAIIVSILLFITFLGSSGYLDFLIPGENDVTKEAFSSMVDQVREGDSVSSAVTAFCLEILENADL